MITTIPGDVEMQKQLTDIHVGEWLREDVGHLRWWILLFMILVLIIIWWILLDKAKLLDICLYTALAVILFMGIGEYGEELTLWDYPVDVLAIFPTLSAANFIGAALIFSQVYQRTNSTKSFIGAALIASAILSLIFEPLLSLGGFFELLHWTYYESTLIYFLVAISTRALVNKILRVMRKTVSGKVK